MGHCRSRLIEAKSVQLRWHRARSGRSGGEGPDYRGGGAIRRRRPRRGRSGRCRAAGEGGCGEETTRERGFNLIQKQALVEDVAAMIGGGCLRWRRKDVALCWAGGKTSSLHYAVLEEDEEQKDETGLVQF